MSRIYLDSCIVIYLHEAEAEIQATIRDRLLPESIERPILHISDLTRLVCRVHPLRLNDTALLADYDLFFSLPAISQIPLSTDVFDRATELRAHYGITTPDAIHLAAAIAGECDQFWTNDHRLTKVEADIMLEILP